MVKKYNKDAVIKEMIGNDPRPVAENTEQKMERKNVQYDKLLALFAGPHSKGVLRIPANKNCKSDLIEDGEVVIPVRLLGISEHHKIDREVLKWYLNIPETERILEHKEHKKIVLTLSAATTPSPENIYNAMFSSTDFEALDLNNLYNIWTAYMDFCSEMSPPLHTVTEYDMAVLTEDLKKNGTLILSLTPMLLRKVTLYLLNLISRIQADKLSSLKSAPDISQP